ncbi:NAD(P)H-dependent FMN reductase C4B3.06c [Acaromyces ingoldii]|uniref:NAD(P)H-dependent FMN reductase C4B3.06c n=1 Tax=Acaromyces ingoldii TaxID=215250 RepID=A0A316YX96_9BASI|nr:NAD(P)H-dependent FMN reductase C4B3.06c [Acaromyces ingoldii]PWN93676.1 NAD(P)H-dependent FMN reductase C4B3.06c [Acaromyces ingoldii]
MSFKVGIIICSIREPRVGPQVAQWLKGKLEGQATSGFGLHLLDLKQYPLPLSYPEGGLPAHKTMTDGDDYRCPETNVWSKEVRKYDGFVFVSPQYNWGYPASIKNALDQLFLEWTGKPGMVVTYGGRGGGKAGEQLIEVLKGLRMQASEDRIELNISPPQTALGPADDATIAKWEEKEEDVKKAWGAFTALFGSK